MKKLTEQRFKIENDGITYLITFTDSFLEIKSIDKEGFENKMVFNLESAKELQDIMNDTKYIWSYQNLKS